MTKMLPNDAVRITALIQGQRDPTRVNIMLDGKFAFSLSAEVVIKRGLTVGKLLSPSEVSELVVLSDSEKIMGKVLNFLSYRPRSEREVRDRLYKYVGTEQTAEKAEIVSKLKKLGYLDDREFARWFVASRRANRPRSVRQLMAELASKGVAKDIIREVVGEGGGGDRVTIRALIAKKSALPREKLIAYLARKGFSWDLIQAEIDGGRE